MIKTMNESQNEEVTKQREQAKSTIRATVPEIEAILYKSLPVLDHGFVRLIDYMGDDSAIVQAARVSYGAGTKKTTQDRGLIFYLMRHRHTTPFEMCEIKLHIKLPIFVARQWIRHRTASVNEYSARYSILGKDFYVPKKEHLAAQSKDNKQGRGQMLNDEESARVLQLLKQDALTCYEHYEEMINEDTEGNIIDESKSNFARELARMNLTLNYYTEWYWKIDLHNLFHFLRLRADSHAQYEIQVYAKVMLDIVKAWVPLAYAAFEEYCLNGTYISGKGLQVVKKMLAGVKVAQEESGMGKREWQELMAIIE
jgi:thymidylate synthase (FAD)